MDKKQHFWRRHKKLWIVLGCVIVLGAGLGGWLYYGFVYCGQHEPAAQSSQTSTEPVIHTSAQELKRALLFYPDFKNMIFGNEAENTEDSLYPVPGLQAAKTLKKGKNKIEMCTEMTPQGITVTEKYVIISAYCHTKKHQSVLYVMDKAKNTFIKEIVLEGTPHAGGIAYDAAHSLLWVSCREDGMAGISAIAMDDLEAYDINQNVSIAYKYTYPVFEIDKSSFMTYYDDHLYIGLFSTDKEGIVFRFDSREDGSLNATILADSALQDGNDFVMLSASQVIEITDDVQGLALTEEYRLLTDSWGVLNSHIKIYPNDSEDLADISDKSKMISSITFPRQLEQICVDGTDLYLLFESGSYAYRNVPLTAMDYVVRVSLSDLQK